MQLRQTPTRDRKVGLVLYGFPPNVGAVGTAALLNVPRSLDAILATLSEAGYNAPTGLSGEALVAGDAICFVGIFCLIHQDSFIVEPLLLSLYDAGDDDAVTSWDQSHIYTLL